jgi:SecD/SecF fusion protein
LQLAENNQSDVLFRMRTVESNADEVSSKVTQAFSETPFKLVQQKVQYSEIKAIASSGDAAASAELVGGQETDVKLAQPILAATLTLELEDALQDLKPDGATASPYPDPTDLVIVTPKTSQLTDKDTEFLVQTRPAVAADHVVQVLESFKQRLESEPAFEEKTTFDASVAGDTQRTAFLAIVLSNIAIIFYLWFRFHQAEFGIAAVVAVMHDVLIVLGLLAIGALLSRTPVGPVLGLTDFKIDLSIVAAFLTIIGYSMNDTIVVFDRIREVRGKNPAITEQMVNLSINQTLSRTLLTSSTTLIVLSILYVMGGEGVHGFSFCMLLGIIVGTFSSVFVASPVLIWLSNLELFSGGARPVRSTAVAAGR